MVICLDGFRRFACLVWWFDGNEVVGVRRWLVLMIMLFGFAFALCLCGRLFAQFIIVWFWLVLFVALLFVVFSV